MCGNSAVIRSSTANDTANHSGRSEIFRTLNRLARYLHRSDRLRLAAQQALRQLISRHSGSVPPVVPQVPPRRFRAAEFTGSLRRPDRRRRVHHRVRLSSVSTKPPAGIVVKISITGSCDANDCPCDCTRSAPDNPPSHKYLLITLW